MSSDMENRMENNFLASENEREQLFHRIEELERRVKVLTDGLQKKIVTNGDYTAPEGMKRIAQETLNQTPQQTAAQIERGHIEWMMKLPVARWINRNPPYSDSADTFKSEHAKEHIPLYLIPPLPKESDSPETNLDMWLRRQ